MRASSRNGGSGSKTVVNDFGLVGFLMFWKRKGKPTEAARGTHAVPEGRRVYAIGDIHGRDDLFGQMIDLIRADHASRDPADMTLILLKVETAQPAKVAEMAEDAEAVEVRP